MTLPYRNRPLWLAAHLAGSDAAAQFRDLVARTCRILGLDDGYRLDLTVGATAALFSARPRRDAFGLDLGRRNRTRHSCMTTVPPLEVDPDDPRWLHRFGKLLEGPLPPIWSRPPPLAYAQHRLDADSLLLANDFFGDGKIYAAKSRDLQLFATSALPLALALPGALTVDRQSWAHYLTFDWLVDDRAFYEGITLLPPGSRATIADGRCVVEQSHDERAVRASGTRADRPDDAISAGIDVVRALSRVGDLDGVTVGLSGGRDSRCVAAMLQQAGIDTAFYTQRPPDLEVDVARQVVAASPRPMRWKEVVSPEVQPQTALPDLEGNARHWFADRDGDCWPTLVRRPPPAGQPAVARRWSVSGGGGEIARGHFYATGDLSMVENRFQEAIRQRSLRPLFQGRYDVAQQQRVVDRILKRRVAAAPLVSAEGREASHRSVMQIAADGRERGHAGLYALDWFYVRSQQRRRVPASFTGSILYPLYTPQMYLYGFDAPLEDKLAGRTTTALTDRMMPEWRDIPYFADLAARMPPAKTNKTMVRPYYWEQDRDAFEDACLRGIAILGDALVPDAADRVRRVKRGDKQAAHLQNFANRVFWRLGFEAYDAEIRAERDRPVPPLPVDLAERPG